jgi:hypothetical protein
MQVAVPWDLARVLLDDVKPRGSDHPALGRDDMVRDWYRATAAWMQNREDYQTLHLDRAREIFPTDPVILFLSGTQAETYAAEASRTFTEIVRARSTWVFAVVFSSAFLARTLYDWLAPATDFVARAQAATFGSAGAAAAGLGKRLRSSFVR